MVDVARERKVITAFCDRLAVLLRQPCTVKEWLEPPNCEAILERAGEPWAIDHTALNSFRNQKADDALFDAVVRPLESSLAPICTDHFVRILFPTGCLSGNRLGLREQLETSLKAIIPTVAEDGEFHRVVLARPKCDLEISRERGDIVGCFPGRILPPNHRQELEQDLERAIHAKSLQLSSYRKGGRRTILLMDTREISSFNEFSVAKAFGAAAARINHGQLDEIYLFAEPTSKFFVWPLKFKEVVPPDLRWIYEFRRAQSSLVFGMKNKGPDYVVE